MYYFALLCVIYEYNYPFYVQFNHIKTVSNGFFLRFSPFFFFRKRYALSIHVYKVYLYGYVMNPKFSSLIKHIIQTQDYTMNLYLNHRRDYNFPDLVEIIRHQKYVLMNNQ